jgi:SARP family transcriptional regulator, regulator of embCAB operon
MTSANTSYLTRHHDRSDVPGRVTAGTRNWPMDTNTMAYRTNQQKMSFVYLGALECWLDCEQVEIRGTSQRTLLAALLTAASKPLSVDALVEELWGADPPARVENALQAHVSRLRRKLHCAGATTPVRLSSLPSGYRLMVPEEDVDATVFMRALKEVHSQSNMDASTAIAKLRSAVALWRGPVFGGPLGGPICQAAAALHEAARSVAVELLFDLELRCGRHTEIIPELSELVESPSLNERFCEQLMVALYRSGRQTEALEVYRRMRTRMDVDLGVEPSPTLRNYESAILAHDPALYAGANHTALRRSA